MAISKNKLDRRPNMTSRTKTNNRAIFVADLSILAPDSRCGALLALEAGSTAQPISEVDDLGQTELSA